MSTRFVRLDQYGFQLPEELPEGVTDWAAVYDYETNLVWDAHDSGAPGTYGDADTYATDLYLLGRSDWRLPSLAEFATLLSWEWGITGGLSRLHQAYFFESSPSGYCWTAEPASHPDYGVRVDYTRFGEPFPGWTHQKQHMQQECDRLQEIRNKCNDADEQACDQLETANKGAYVRWWRGLLNAPDSDDVCDLIDQVPQPPPPALPLTVTLSALAYARACRPNNGLV